MRYIFIILTLLTACTYKYNLRQAEKHLRKAQLKGAVIHPDTIWKDRPVYIPAQDSSVKTNPVLDSSKFETVITKYDSLVRVTATLVSKDELVKAQKEIKKLKARLIKGFSKDSTYTYPIDSITKITVVLKDGLVDSVGLDRKPVIIYKSMPIAIDNTIKAGWPWWYLLIAFVVGANVGLVIMAIVRGRKTD